jgi:hypothetical protein
MANAVLFNTIITAGGTNQVLDPSGVEQLSYAQTIVIKALSTNAGIIYVQNSPTAAATSGFPLEAGDSIVLLFPTTGLYVNGVTTGDVYGVAAS